MYANKMMSDNYKTTDNLDARVNLHKNYSRSDLNYFDWYLSKISLPQGSVVLELGSGLGTFWNYVDTDVLNSLSLTLSDNSSAMCQELDERFEAMHNVNVLNLSISDSLVLPVLPDILICNHALYHVPNNRAALSNIFTQMKNGDRIGSCYFGTNSYSSMEKLSSFLPERFGRHCIGQVVKSFSLESGYKLVTEVFGHAESHTFEDSLLINAVEPVMSYLYSMQLDLTTGEANDIENNISNHIENHGVLEVAKATGFITNNVGLGH